MNPVEKPADGSLSHEQDHVVALARLKTARQQHFVRHRLHAAAYDRKLRGSITVRNGICQCHVKPMSEPPQHGPCIPFHHETCPKYSDAVHIIFFGNATSFKTGGVACQQGSCLWDCRRVAEGAAYSSMIWRKWRDAMSAIFELCRTLPW